MNKPIYYQGADGHTKVLGENELQHWKYIKKIGNRYFYTPEELRAYYAESKTASNREAAFNRNKANAERASRDAFNNQARRDLKEGAKNTVYIDRDKKGNLKFRDATKDEVKKEQKKIDKRYDRRDKVDKLIDRLSDTKINAKKKIDPVAKTVKMAAQGKEKPKTTKSKYSDEDKARIRYESSVRKAQQDQVRKKKNKKKSYKYYSAPGPAKR